MKRGRRSNLAENINGETNTNINDLPMHRETRSAFSSPLSPIIKTARRSTRNQNPFQLLNGVASFQAINGPSQDSTELNSSVNKATNSLSNIDPKKPRKRKSTSDLRLCNKKSVSDEVVCKWSTCNLKIDVAELLDHLLDKHIKHVKDKEKMKCLWEGCKIEKVSRHSDWLDQHILIHVGNRPYSCVIPECKMRFTNRLLQRRHINSHFPKKDTSEASSNNGSNSTFQSQISKEQNKRKKKRRRKDLTSCIPLSPLVDYFNSPSLQYFHDRIETFANSLQFEIAASQPKLTFNCQIIARRTLKSKEKQVLVRWYPENMIPDEWISSSEFQPIKEIGLRILQTKYSNLKIFSSFYHPLRYRSSRRK